MLLEELRGGDAEVVFELAGEVLGIVESEMLGGLIDIHAADEQRLRPLHDEVADGVARRLAGPIFRWSNFCALQPPQEHLYTQKRGADYAHSSIGGSEKTLHLEWCK